MKSENALFELIHSLTSSEKRYVSGYFARGEGKYANLYRAILSQTEYNESEIRKRFQGEKFLKQLSVAKSYLYDLLLRALRNYHHERTNGILMRAELDKVELLILRGLDQQAANILRKLKSKAIRLEVWEVHLECLKFQKHLVRRSGAADLAPTLDGLKKEQDTIIGLIQQETELRKLYDAIFSLRRKTEQVRNQPDIEALEKIHNSAILRAPCPTSIRLATLYTYSHLYSAQLRGEVHSVVAHYQSLLAMWEADRQVMRHDEERYLRTLMSYLDILLGISPLQAAEIDLLFSKIENLKLNLSSLNLLRSNYLFHLRIRYFGSTDQFGACISYVSKHRDTLANYLQTSSQAMRMSMLHNLLMLHFLEAEFSSALEFAEALIQEKNPGLRSDLQLFARLLVLPIHYELGNLEILEYILRSSRRYFTRNADLLPFEERYFKHFRDLIHATDQKETQQVFEQFYQSMTEFARLNPVLGLEELRRWLEKKSG